MPDFPSHASPAFPAIASPRPQYRDRGISDLNLSAANGKTASDPQTQTGGSAPPPLVSPAFTPPQTPFTPTTTSETSPSQPKPLRQPHSIPIPPPPTTSDEALPPQLLERLPNVHCEVRARIPTTTGQEMFLHLYHNDADEKEHLAIVFGPHIRSRSLDAPRQGESEYDRMLRGAYTGTLYPGRVSSKGVGRVGELRRDAGVGSGSVSGGGNVGFGGDEEIVGEEQGYPAELGPPMVRIHSECYTGETVWSARCDCGEQLDEAARLMSLPAPTPVSTPGSEGGGEGAHEHRFDVSKTKLPPCGGVIVYLRQEGRGIGLLSKLKAYNLQDLGHDTMEANILLRHPGDARSYGLATAMLLDLGLGGERGIRLLTNNPEKVRAVEGPGREVRVVERVPMVPIAWTSGGEKGVRGPEVERYLSTKIEKFKHMFGEGG
ncbi:hypothetical protein MBLNU230_g7017t1 [Neophaeotheca triangularis]